MPVPPADTPRPDPHSGDSILDALARRSGRETRVHLRDVGTGDAAPIIDPKARSYQDELSRADREKYRVLGEIARGGMGVVLRGHDTELGRDVAMKVVHAELADRPEVLARFVEEAQVGGQLQHPGIVPVYELGLMADQRPYFTMKLIKGRTLAAMLARRKSPDEERLRYLGIFEAVCQTMAYAHSKGVIHRDLKPANVMVGAFGEVQVVDWGLSKVMSRGGIADELAAQDNARTVIETVRSGPRSGSDSLVGNVLGTPAYMSPEQARGEIDQLDERTDVFALGAILCELLTGAPPYVAAEGQNLLQMAALAELDGARARIAAASAPEELKKLCLACLLPSRAARPAGAEELAGAVHRHVVGLESAAHEAQLAAAEQRVRAERSRRRHQLTLLSAGALVLLGSGAWWVDAERRARDAELERGLDEARALVQSEERAGSYERALDAARGGLRLVEAGGADDELVARAAELVATTEAAWKAEESRRAAAAREERLLAQLADLQMRQMYTGINLTNDDVAAEYRSAFGTYGLDLLDPDLGPRLLALRDTPLGVQLAIAFDGWARVVRRIRGAPKEEVELLTGIGFDLDTDAVRTTVREALVQRDASALVESASAADLAAAEPATLFLLASALLELGETEVSLRVMTTGADRHPADFALTSGAGLAHYAADNPARAATYLAAALALRPDLALLHSWLGDARKRAGDVAGSRISMQMAMALAPDGRWNMREVALDSMLLGRFDEAALHLAEVRRYLPNDLSLEALERTSHVYMGTADFEEYLTWSLSRANEEPEALIWPAIMLAVQPPPGAALDPARALRLIDYAPDPDWAILALIASAAHAQLGNGAETRSRAAVALERLSPGDLNGIAHAMVFAAVGARMQGDDAMADLLLLEARRARAEVVLGREADWTRSLLTTTFERFEPLAAGR